MSKHPTRRAPLGRSPAELLEFRIQDGLIGLLVRQADDVLSAGELVDWATSALVAGCETPALVVLAGLSRSESMAEVQPWLARSLAELEIALPPLPELRRAYIGVVSRAFLHGKLPPQEALDLVHRHVVEPLSHPADLMPWCYLWEGIGPVHFEDLSGQRLEEETKLLAEQWAGRRALDPES